MKQVAKEFLPKCFGVREENIIPEFDYGKGRTDLVLVNISNDYWSHRSDQLNLSQPIIDEQHLISFLQIHGRGPVTEDFFIACGAQPKRKKRESLKWLRNNGFITELDSGKIRTARNLRRHVTTTLAIELKLEKWKTALRQASMGRSFAEYRYVAIDEDHIDPAYANLDEFKSNNVGLLSINDSGETTIHWSPERGDPYSNLYQWKINEKSVSEVST
ncbi:hypothetical protein [Halobacterium wangiae]|uniref:hypothetical protein n=1 Tax=Halobacterium wangiae TaxID=2902623 RepID=UPI001E60893E|nr:hypothetical protein [Halobacterium wangiae]